MNIELDKVYEHYKGGRYTIIGIGFHSETLEEYVVYKSQKNSKIWLRPKEMFNETVVVNNDRVPRFKLIESDE